MNIINLNRKNQNNPLDIFMKWLEPDIIKINQSILKNLLGSEPLISDLSNHIIGSGGKRIRPLLTIACSKLCNYIGSRHIELASVIEFIHTATLLHDDVIDESKLRRGSQTTNSIWGNQSSILVGDYLLSRCFEMMVEDGDLEILKLLSSVKKKVTCSLWEGNFASLKALKRAA